MTKRYFVFLLLSTSLFLCFGQGQSQTSSRARHHNFYHRIDVGSGNLYTCALTSCITGGINYLLDDAVFETSFRYPSYRYSDCRTLSLTKPNMVGLFKADLLSDFSGGIKLGYQTYNPDVINWGVYGSAHYYNNTLTLDYGESKTITYDVASFGGGAFLTLGQMSQAVRWTLDFSLEYGKNVWNNMADYNGFYSHYSVGISGPGLVQNMKIFADVAHFPVVYSPVNIYPMTFGVSWTITPKQVNNKRW